EGYEVVNPKNSVILRISWTIPDETLEKSLGMEVVSVRQTIFLDVNEETGQLEFGANKNVRLGRLRKSLNMNKPGKPFQWADLNGKSATISVSQRADDNDATIIYNDVVKITAR
ncbi:MAG: hypothetical protein L3J79_05890, partial [Candidatus Marinimicrobia bacterium]|nr:hypothetical protein [Candidatus Neomarinimicrobiota bacterium]